jgi:hypothetical protein
MMNDEVQCDVKTAFASSVCALSTTMAAMQDEAKESKAMLQQCQQQLLQLLPASSSVHHL